jgi:hypothetical protein
MHIIHNNREENIHIKGLEMDKYLKTFDMDKIRCNGDEVVKKQLVIML